MIRVFLIDALGNLALFGLAYYWFGIPASSATNLALSAALLALILALAAYLVALAFNRDPVASTRRIPVMLIWLAVLALLFAALTPVWGWATPIGNWLGSALTFGTRTPVKPEWIATLFRLGVLLFGGLVLIAGLFPAAARAATTGTLRDWRPVLSLGYIAGAFTYFFAGLWLPWTLFWWIPAVQSFEGQMASFLARAGLAFGIFVFAWLVFAAHIRQRTLSPEREAGYSSIR